MFHRPPILHRLFLALVPPPQLARRTAAAALWFDDGRGALPAERLHMTMLILDDVEAVDPAHVAALGAIAATVGVGPFDVTLDVASGSGRSVALRPQHRNPALAGLRERLAAGAAAHGLAQHPDCRFSPHLTLGYRAGAPFTERVAPVRWTADEIVLIDSHVGRTRHQVLGRWPLVKDEREQLALF